MLKCATPMKMIKEKMLETNFIIKHNQSPLGDLGVS